MDGEPSRSDRSAGAVRFNSRIPLAEGCGAGRVYLITKKEQDVRTGALTVCVLWGSVCPPAWDIKDDLLL